MNYPAISLYICPPLHLQPASIIVYGELIDVTGDAATLRIGPDNFVGCLLEDLVPALDAPSIGAHLKPKPIAAEITTSISATPALKELMLDRALEATLEEIPTDIHRTKWAQRPLKQYL